MKLWNKFDTLAICLAVLIMGVFVYRAYAVDWVGCYVLHYSGTQQMLNGVEVDHLEVEGWTGGVPNLPITWDNREEVYIACYVWNYAANSWTRFPDPSPIPTQTFVDVDQFGNVLLVKDITQRMTANIPFAGIPRDELGYVVKCRLIVAATGEILKESESELILMGFPQPPAMP